MRITMFDRLRQAQRVWHHQSRTPPLARHHRLARRLHQDVLLALPAITEPAEGTLVRALDRAGHGSLDQALAH
ncbi:MAG: hypothetical protein NVS2B2_06590 [Ktedonobacteraceae bacterium]